MPSTFPVSILGPFNGGWMCHVTCVVRCLNHEVTSHDLLLALGQVPVWWYLRSCRLLCKIVSCPVYVKTGLIQLFLWCDGQQHQQLMGTLTFREFPWLLTPGNRLLAADSAGLAATRLALLGSHSDHLPSRISHQVHVLWYWTVYAIVKELHILAMD